MLFLRLALRAEPKQLQSDHPLPHDSVARTTEMLATMRIQAATVGLFVEFEPTSLDIDDGPAISNHWAYASARRRNNIFCRK